MVRRGRRFESVRGLCKSAARRRFLVQNDLVGVERAVGMEPWMEPSGSRRTARSAFAPGTTGEGRDPARPLAGSVILIPLNSPA